MQHTRQVRMISNRQRPSLEQLQILIQHEIWQIKLFPGVTKRHLDSGQHPLRGPDAASERPSPDLAQIYGHEHR